MPVELDIAPIEEQTRLATGALDRIGEAMKRVLDDKAREERSGHEYQNRTYRLQGSTFASGPFGGGNQDVVVEYGARMDYASYVEAKGLSRVSELAKEAEGEIAAQFDLLVELSGG